MPEVKYKPVQHDHKAFLAKASTRKGFAEAYEAWVPEYQLARRCANGDLQEICNDDKA